jgi:hypothetical protein
MTNRYSVSPATVRFMAVKASSHSNIFGSPMVRVGTASNTIDITKGGVFLFGPPQLAASFIWSLNSGSGGPLSGLLIRASQPLTNPRHRMGDALRGRGDTAGSLLESGPERTWPISSGTSLFDPYATIPKAQHMHIRSIYCRRFCVRTLITTHHVPETSPLLMLPEPINSAFGPRRRR